MSLISDMLHCLNHFGKRGYLKQELTLQVNILLHIGLLVLTGYLLGLIVEKMGVPKIIGYILTGIMFSPDTMGWSSIEAVTGSSPLLSISLAFIAFEVGGELKWSKLKKMENKVLSITLLEGLMPVIFIIVFFYVIYLLFPSFSPFADTLSFLVFSILLASLASPTDPASSLAIIHQYKAKGAVEETILGVAAHDDALGILIFSIAIAIGSFLLGQSGELQEPILFFVENIAGGVVVGLVLALVMSGFVRYFSDLSEGQWIILIFALISICYGAASAVGADEILACMVMGMVVVNTSKEHDILFRIIERYTEELILLFFFVLSGLHFNIQTVPDALLPIALYVSLRITGKFAGSYLGATLSGARAEVRKYTGGGLIPQGGVVIGLALIVNQYPKFDFLFEQLLTVIMGAVLINELIGPFITKYTLSRAGEISLDK